MTVTVNGAERHVEDGTSLADVVASVTSTAEGSARGIAVAVNGAVVRRASWGSTTLVPDDHVEVLTAVQGG